MTATQFKKDSNPPEAGVQGPFESISLPGTYYSSWSGHLLRVPEDALQPGRSPVVEIRGKEPMSIDEAALALEGSRHDFVVFRDASTERVSVLYKRKDDNYGLIAPEF